MLLILLHRHFSLHCTAYSSVCKICLLYFIIFLFCYAKNNLVWPIHLGTAMAQWLNWLTCPQQVWVQVQLPPAGTIWIIGSDRKGILPKLLMCACKSPTLVGMAKPLNKGVSDGKFWGFGLLLLEVHIAFRKRCYTDYLNQLFNKELPKNKAHWGKKHRKHLFSILYSFIYSFIRGSYKKIKKWKEIHRHWYCNNRKYNIVILCCIKWQHRARAEYEEWRADVRDTEAAHGSE